MTTHLFKIITSFFFFLLFTNTLSQDLKNIDFHWQRGEVLIYSVKWSFIKLGQLRLEIIDEDTVNNRKVYYCRIRIDSSPGLPFVNIHDIYESYIDAEEIYSHHFLAYEKKGDYILFTEYIFNYNNNTVSIIIEKRWNDKKELVLDSTAVIPQKVYDSLSMLYFARAMSKRNCAIKLPVFVYNKFEKTELNFSGRKELFKFRDQKIPGYFVDGQLKFIGIAGIKEDFKGWFSLDEQCVPVKALMKAFIGSVKIELKEWKNWKGE